MEYPAIFILTWPSKRRPPSCHTPSPMPTLSRNGINNPNERVITDCRSANVTGLMASPEERANELSSEISNVACCESNARQQRCRGSHEAMPRCRPAAGTPLPCETSIRHQKRAPKLPPPHAVTLPPEYRRARVRRRIVKCRRRLCRKYFADKVIGI